MTMDIYRKVLLECSKNQKFSTLYNNLKKLSFSTEDEVLINLINEYCRSLRPVMDYISRKLPMNASEAEGVSLTYRVTLNNYCKQIIESRKPEWQIIAERNGWAKVR